MVYIHVTSCFRIAWTSKRLLFNIEHVTPIGTRLKPDPKSMMRNGENGLQGIAAGLAGLHATAAALLASPSKLIDPPFLNRLITNSRANMQRQSPPQIPGQD